MFKTEVYKDVNSAGVYGKGTAPSVTFKDVMSSFGLNPASLPNFIVDALKWVSVSLLFHFYEFQCSMKWKQKQQNRPAIQRSEISKRSAQTQSEDQCGYQPGVHKSEDQGWNKSDGSTSHPL